MFRSLSGAALLLGALAVSAQTPDPAHRLILAMSADQSAAVETGLGYRQLGEQGQITQKLTQCMQKLDRSAFTDVFARTVAEQLTPDEIKDATQFYESEVGQKFVKVQLVDAYAQFDAAPPEPAPELSESEKASIAAFLCSPAGTKLIGNAVLTDSPQGRKATRERILELHARCSA